MLNTNKSCVQPTTTAINVTLLAFAVDCRVAVRRAVTAPLLLGAGRCRSISHCPRGAQQQTSRTLLQQ